MVSVDLEVERESQGWGEVTYIELSTQHMVDSHGLRGAERK